jgi:uncharacterized delta-60 repeat protein
MRTDRTTTHRPDDRARTTPRGRRRPPTTRRAPFFESLEPRTLLSSGQLDTTFGYQGAVPIIGAPVEQIVSDSEGRLLVAGAYSMSRYNVNGQLDTTFGSLGTATIPGAATGVSNGIYISDMALEPDGKIVVLAGDSIDRFWPNGSIDTTFGTNGVTAPITINVGGQQLPLTVASGDYGARGFTVLPDGDILVAGTVTVPSVGEEAALAMYLPDGTLDPSFNGTGTLNIPPEAGQSPEYTTVVNVAVDQGQILVLTGTSAPNAIQLYEFNPDGTTNSSFGTNGEISVPGPTIGDYPSLAVQPDGKILLGYLYTSQTILSGDEIITRYNSGGSLDTTFGTDGQASVDDVLAIPLYNIIALQPNGKLIVTSASVSYDSNNDGMYDPYLYRLDADGSPDTSFGDGGGTAVPIQPENQFSSPALTTVQPDGRILVATGSGTLYGIVGDPVVSFGGATSYSAASGTPTAEYDVSETAGSAMITLTRGGDLTQPLTVPFSTDDSGGYGGVNYTPVNTTVTFAAGSATATVSIPILVDPNASPAVDIPLVLGTPSDGAVLGAYPAGVLQIEPTEGIVTSAAQISSVAVQGPSSTFTVALQTVPAGNVTVPLSISTTSPAASLSATSLVFRPADALTPQTVTVTAVSNSGAEGATPAIAIVTAGPATSTDPKYNGLAGATVQVGVYDDGALTPGFIEFAAPNFTDDETASSATITLERLGGSNGSVPVHFATSDGSSNVNGDYTPLSGSISFGPGVTSRTFSITLTGPGYNLDGDQTVDLTLSDPTGGAQLGVLPTATLTLHDPYAIAAGDLDPAFGDSGAAVLPETINDFSGGSSGVVPDISAVLPDGNVILAGTGGTYLQLWETTQTGQPVASFGQGGLLDIPLSSVPSLRQIAVESDGSLIMAGNFNGNIVLIKLNPDGSVDTSFGTNGEVIGSYSAGDNTLNSIIVESDDSLLVCATLDTANDASSTTDLIHFEPDGSLDIGFGTGGVLDVPSIAGAGDMVQQPDGKLLFVISGSYNGGSYGDGGEVVRLDTDFTPDPTFGTNGVATLSWGEFQSTAIVQPDGKILIGGGGSVQATLGRLNSDGSIDTTFGQDGSVTIGYGTYGSDFNSLILLGDGKIVAVGDAYDPFGSDGGTAEACFLPDGALDPYFVGGGNWLLNNYPNLESGVALPDGDVLVAGGVNTEPVMEAILTSVPASSPAPGQEPGQLAFAASMATVTAGTTATITVDRMDGSDGTASVPYTTQDDTAVAGTDYTTTSGTLTFGPGVTSQTISIPTLVDPGASGSLSLDVLLGTPAGGATVGTPDDLFLTITQPASTPPAPTEPVITWADPSAIIYGTPLSATQLDATANVPGTFSYSPALDTTLDAGNNQALSVTFTPTDTTDYTTATAASEINVAQATPLITWADPAAIAQGTSLGAAQLDATANVPGTFSYSPPLGTVLQAGNDQKLSVNFTPTDTTDYTSATDTVYIEVENANRSVPTITWANPVGITYGTPLSSAQLDATASVPGTFIYSLPAGTVLPAGDNQALSVTFTPNDTVDYTSASNSVPINVAQAQTTLRFGNLSLPYNGLSQSTTVTTSPAGLAGVSITYSQNGLPVASPTAAGTYQVTASLDNPNYTAQPIMGTMTITQPTTPTPTQTVIMGEQPFFQRKLNKKGKPTGKAVLGGFTIDFEVALNAAAADNAANYQLDTVTTKKVKKKIETTLHPVANFRVSYIAASDAVQLTFGSKQAFPMGGRITVLPGLTTASGATLTGPAVFTITKGGNSVVPS